MSVACSRRIIGFNYGRSTKPGVALFFSAFFLTAWRDWVQQCTGKNANEKAFPVCAAFRMLLHGNKVFSAKRASDKADGRIVRK